MEILAPCGSPEHVRAAVNCGADAVYMGTRSLSARRNAANFTQEELGEATRFCHANDVKVYLTVNTLLFDSEEQLLLETLGVARETGVDALIVQDWGVADFVRRRLPGMPLHASTQTSIHTVAGAKAARKMGFERVVFARELAAEDIGRISREGGVDAEVFVHGALCGGVSGQCYFSALLGSRSGNRGLCAQPCRLDFQATGRHYAFSLKDLCLIDRMRELKELGVVSLKIEGRMKRPEYVAAAVDACRKALDGKKPDMERLASVFSRSGFTSGFFDGSKRDMNGIRTREDADASASVMPELSRLPAKAFKRRSLEMRFTMKSGIPATLELFDGKNSVLAEGDLPQAAVTRATSPAEAERQLTKLGDTPFEAKSFEAEIEPGLTLPLSGLNALRRRAAEELAGMITAQNTPRYEETGEKWMPPAVREPSRERFLRGECQTVEQWEACLRAGIDGSLPLEVCLRGKLPPGRWPMAALPRWMDGHEENIENQLARLKELGLGRVLCQNIAHVEMGSELGLETHGGWGLNAANSRSLYALEKMGIADCVLSVELTLRQKPEGLPSGRVVYGHQPLMLLARCPVRDAPVSADCRGCETVHDRTGRKIRLRCDGCSVEVLNPDKLWMADRLSEIADGFLVLQFDRESGEEAAEIISAYKKGGPKPACHTRGLLYRGVE